MPSRAEWLDHVYDELRRVAAAKISQESPGQTLSATGLVHEAFLRIGADQSFENRAHFYAAASEAMRRILVDAARKRKTAKHGNDHERLEISLDRIGTEAPESDILALHDALEQFTAIDPAKAELVKLRYFAGLSADEAAELLGISPATADRWWVFARAWLRRKMDS
jgi:RNA polymerase sigma factor (TIGR02999 family)